MLRSSKRKQDGGADLAERHEPAAAHDGATTTTGTNKRKGRTTVAADASCQSPITFTCLSSEIIQKSRTILFSAMLWPLPAYAGRRLAQYDMHCCNRFRSSLSRAQPEQLHHAQFHPPTTKSFPLSTRMRSKGWTLSTPAMLAYRYRVRPRLCVRCYQMDVASLSTKLALGLVKPFSRQ